MAVQRRALIGLHRRASPGLPGSAFARLQALASWREAQSRVSPLTRSSGLGDAGPATALSSGTRDPRPPARLRLPPLYSPSPLDLSLLPSLQMRKLRPNTSYTNVQRPWQPGIQKQSFHSSLQTCPIRIPPHTHPIAARYLKDEGSHWSERGTCKAPRTGLAPWVSSYIKSAHSIHTRAPGKSPPLSRCAYRGLARHRAG